MPPMSRNPACPNPLFLEWLSEWADQAQELTKNPRYAGSKAHYALRKAHDSMKKYPLPLVTGLDAKCLEGIGDAIAMRLQQRLTEHCAANDLPPPEGGTTDGNATQASRGVSREAPKARPTKRKSSEVTNATDESSDEEIGVDKPKPAKKPTKANTKGRGSYVPRYRSGAYGILLALLTAHEKASDGDEGGAYLSKSEICERGQPFVDSPFKSNEADKFYTAWNGVSILVQKNLVYKSGSQYCLTEDGVTLAKKMMKVAELKGQNPKEDEVEQLDVSRTSSQTSSSVVVAENASNDAVEPTNVPLQFWYLDCEDLRVRRRADAQVIIDESTTSLNYRVEYHSLQRRHSDARNLARLTRLSRDGNLIADMNERFAPEICPGIDVRLLVPSPGASQEPTARSTKKLPKNLSPPSTSGHEDLPQILSISSSDSSNPSRNSSSTYTAKNPTSVQAPLTTSSSSQAPCTNFTPLILPANSFKIICIVDAREVRLKVDRDYIPLQLKRRNITCEQRVLEVGDVTWIARREETDEEVVLDYVLERKRLDDLVGSIKDGRFVEQKFRLDNSGLSNVIYLVEDYNMQVAVNFGLNAIYSAMATTQVGNGYFVKRTSSVDETIEYLARMTRMLNQAYESKPIYAIPDSRIERRTYNALRVGLSASSPSRCYHVTFAGFQKLNSKTRSLTLTDLFMKFMMCTRGISAEKAQEIAALYRTPKRLLESFHGQDDVNSKETMIKDQCVGLGRKKLGVNVSKKVFEIWCQKRYC